MFKFYGYRAFVNQKCLPYKSFINTIDMNLAGQCCLIRDQENWSERVKVNNMKILDTNMIFARAVTQ